MLAHSWHSNSNVLPTNIALPQRTASVDGGEQRLWPTALTVTDSVLYLSHSCSTAVWYMAVDGVIDVVVVVGYRPSATVSVKPPGRSTESWLKVCVGVFQQ